MVRVPSSSCEFRGHQKAKMEAGSKEDQVSEHSSSSGGVHEKIWPVPYTGEEVGAQYLDGVQSAKGFL